METTNHPHPFSQGTDMVDIADNTADMDMDMDKDMDMGMDSTVASPRHITMGPLPKATNC